MAGHLLVNEYSSITNGKGKAFLPKGWVVRVLRPRPIHAFLHFCISIIAPLHLESTFWY